jgi:hypothetical protein
MFEFECCMATPGTMGDDTVCGVFWRTMGDEADG